MVLVNDIVTRLYINGDWRDVSTSVRASRGISFRRGRMGEDTTTPSQHCSFDLESVNGVWSDRNPLGTYYGYLRRNIPMEVGLRVVKDTASSTVSNGWGSTDTPTGAATGAWQVEPWTVVGTTSNYAKASGLATHAVNAAGSTRTSYLSAFRGRDVDAEFTVKLSVTNVTGGALTQGIAIGNILLRGQGAASTYYRLNLVVQTDETLTVDWRTQAGDLLSVNTVTVSGITHVNTNVYRVRVQAEGRVLRAKIWLNGTPEPYAFTITTVDETDVASSDTLRDAQGWVGLQSSILTGCTNTNITVSYDDLEIRVPIFAGEIAEWPQERDVTGNDRVVSIVAQGPRRRLAQGNSLARSALYNFTTNATFLGRKDPFAYWPLEGGEQTSLDNLDIMGTTSRLTFNQPGSGSTVGVIKWGADTSRPGSYRSPTIVGGGSLNAILEPPTETQSWAVQWQQRLNFREGVTNTFQTVAYPGGGEITITSGLAAGSTTFNVGLIAPGISAIILSHVFDSEEEANTWHTFAISAEPDTVTPGDTNIFLYVDGVTGVAYTAVGMSNLPLVYVGFASFPDSTGDMAIGHITVYSGDLTSWDWINAPLAAAGWLGESPIARVSRLADEYRFEYGWFSEDLIFLNGDGKPMGAQRVVALTSLLDDAERIDGGLLYEQRSVVGFMFRDLTSMLSRTPYLTLDMGSSKHLSPPLLATTDDRLTANSVTAQRADGGAFTVTRTDGPMAAVPAFDGGIGEYLKTLPVNAQLETDLPDLASWAVANGTIDQERYATVNVLLQRSAIQNTAGLVSKLRELDVGDLITLASLQSNYVYDDPDTLVLGVEGYLDKLRYELKLNTVPAEVYRTLIIGSTAGASSEFSRLDSAHTTVDEDLDATETGVTILIATGSAFWVDSTNYAAHFPFDVVVGGEQMTVTACTVPAGQNQTMTVTRNVNGLPGGKTHLTGASLSLYRPNYYGL